VGSGCYDVTSFKKAIHDAYEVFKMAEEEGFNLTLLDIGGGWSGTNDVKPTFQDIAVAIRPILDELFPEGKVNIIAEPGRYFAAASHTMVCNVFAKRHMPENVKLGEPEYLYYINDGLYGSFNCLYFDHAKITIKTVTFGKRSKKKHLCTIFGQVHQPRCPFFVNRCMNISKTKNFNQEDITLSIKKQPPIDPLIKPQVQNARYSYK
jgi:ornithine decarboxylase